MDPFILISLPLALISAILVSYYFPKLTVIGYIVFGVFPRAFSERFDYEFYDTAIGGGFNAVDVFIIGMACVIAIKILRTKGLRRFLRIIAFPSLAFLLWLLIEIARNVTTYGLSSPGEFRGRYFMLISLFYVLVNFDTEKKRRDLLPILSLFVIYSVLAMTIFTGIMTGWDYGPENRFMHSSVSLAMSEAFLAYIIFQKYGLMSKNLLQTFALSFPVFLLVIVDSHRSVWLCLVVFVAFLFFIKELRVSKIFKLAIPLVVTLVLVSMILEKNRMDLVGYISERSIAYVDYEEDPTSAWRVAIWINAFEVILQYPLAGIGFGGHWEAITMPGTTEGMNLFPHSIYIMTLVKLGVIGLILYLWYVLRIGKILYRAVETCGDFLHIEKGYVVLALGYLLVINVYGLVYGFEHLSWLFVGLGLAAIKGKTMTGVTDAR
ncbi:O-antigen ligase family protein [bacterium]|nr:MAG: O-antigen ligase family protein [bacterium]